MSGKLYWCPCLFESAFDAVHRVSNAKIADALSLVQTDEHYTIELKDAILVLTVMPAENANEGKRDGEVGRIIDEALDLTEPGLPASCTIATASTLLNEQATAELLPEQAKGSLCPLFSSTAGKPGFDYAFCKSVFLVCIALVECAIQKGVLQSLQARLLYANPYPRLPGHAAERSIYDTMRCEVYWPHKDYTQPSAPAGNAHATEQNRT